MTVSQKIKHYLWIFIEYFSLIFFSFVALLPVVSCVITAFKTETEYQNTNVMTLPESWLNFDNFIQAFNKANMGRAFINSFIVLVFVVFGSVMVGSHVSVCTEQIYIPRKWTDQKPFPVCYITSRYRNAGCYLPVNVSDWIYQPLIWLHYSFHGY